LIFSPDSFDPAMSVVLIVISFFGSLITASVGIGGGIVLLAAMATVMPTPAVIPVHGAVQLASNAGRLSLLRAHIDWQVVAVFGLGTAVGIALGGNMVVTLPTNILRIGLGCFILYSVWGPAMRLAGRSNIVVAGVGLIASFLTMFFGATGSFISAMLRQRPYTPHQLVATHSVCMALQHSFKVIAFAVLGFVFAEWAGLIALMMLSGLGGTYLGSLILNRLPAASFATGLKAILTLLALNLLASGLGLYRLI
jgi:uncharacterized membrane protein YfcA